MERVRRLKRCDLPERYWVLTPVAVYEGRGVFCVESGAEPDYCIAARSKSAYEQLCRRLRRMRSLRNRQ